MTRKPQGGTPPGALVREGISLSRLADFREAAYRLLSVAFLYPDGASIAAAGTGSDDDILDRFAFSEQWRRLRSSLSGLLPSDMPRLQSRYVALFVTAPATVPCPPYESAYRAQPGRDSAWVLTDLEREYASAGVSLSPALNESPDHVSLETEFMAILCGRESQAWRQENHRQGIRLLNRQRRFLDSHLGAWLSTLVRTLAAADEGGLYATLGTAAEAFVTHDRDILEMLAEMMSGQEEGGGGVEP